jgi:WD40 repeat protein
VTYDGAGRIVCGGSDGSVMLFSLGTGSLLSTVGGAHRGSVLSITWDSSRLLVVSGGADGCVVGWRPARGRQDALEAAEVKFGRKSDPF